MLVILWILYLFWTHLGLQGYLCSLWQDRFLFAPPGAVAVLRGLALTEMLLAATAR